MTETFKYMKGVKKVQEGKIFHMKLKSRMWRMTSNQQEERSKLTLESIILPKKKLMFGKDFQQR